MTSQSAVGPVFGPASGGNVGRQLTSALLALVLTVALLAAVVAIDSGMNAVPSTPRSIPEGDSLHLAIVHVLDTTSSAEISGELAPSAALEDAWATLAEVLGRFEAQESVAQGTRPPLMNAPPPELASAARDRALTRSAAVYVRGALEANDVRSLQRARDLLEMRSR
jgi:hypothetical protein